MRGYYDRQGKKIDVMKWATLLENFEYKRVTQDWIPYNQFEVSTVWLGLDHSFGGWSEPLIFETMVFSGEGRELDCARYASEGEANAGHIKMLAYWREKSALPVLISSWLRSNRWRFKAALRKPLRGK